MKTASGALDTHLQQEVTTVATCFLIKRKDNVRFFFTEHDLPLNIDAEGTGGQTYIPSSSYNRSAISNNDTLSVDNLDITGVLNSTEIDQTELRRGLFDFAEIKIFLVNWADLSMGILKLRRGWIGEVTITPNGFFKSELRGLTQVFSREVIDVIQPECRVDLGSDLCKIPILPEAVLRNTSFAIGDFVRASSALEGVALPAFLAPYDVDVDDKSENAATGTIGSAASLQTVEKKFGAGAMEFDYDGGANDPSLSFVSYPDISQYTIGDSEFTIECWVRFKDLTETFQVMMSHYDRVLGQRAWFLSRDSGDLRFFLSDDGSGFSPAGSILGAFSWAIDTWYHIAVSRDSSDDVRMFVDGVQVGSTTAVTFAVHNSTAPLLIGKFLSTTFDDRSLDGFVDDPRITIGVAIYTSNFTPPVIAHQSPAEIIATLTCGDYDDRIYECTVAGVTATIQPAYNTGVGNTTVDGGATFTTREAWSRCIEVTAVGSDLRKDFTVTELTPNAGGGIPGQTNFPEDIMNGGVVVWETGPNAGTAMEVRNFVADDGMTITQDISLFLDLHFDITIGDKASIYRGCLKRLLPDCRDVFDNVINHRGEAYLPGMDSFVQTPGGVK